MGEKTNEIGFKTLHRISLPDSHEAGMCINECGPDPGMDAYFITQKMTIRDRLVMGVGVRYFDLRLIQEGLHRSSLSAFAGTDRSWRERTAL